jgi:hypothetical protein
MLITKLVGLLLAASTTFTALGPAFADVFVYKDGNGVLTFTNVPNHTGYRRVIREGSSPGSVGSGGSMAYEDVIRSISVRHSMDADLVRDVIRAE